MAVVVCRASRNGFLSLLLIGLLLTLISKLSL